MANFLARFSSWMEVASKILMASCIIFLVLIVLLMNLEILTRYFLGTSIHIGNEYSGYLFCALTMLSFFPTLRSGRFLQITGAVRRLPLKAQAVFELVAVGLGAALCAACCWATAEQAWQSHVFDSVSLSVAETPLAIPQAILPIGFAILVLGFAEFGAVRVRQLWLGQPLKDEVNHVVD